MHTRERILDAVEHLVARYGIEELRLHDVAEAVGIRIPSIYGHFESREALYEGLVDRYVKLTGEIFCYEEDFDPTTVLLDGIREWVRIMIEHPAFARLELRDMERTRGFSQMSERGVGVGEDIERSPFAPLYGRLRRMLERGHELGQFCKLDVVWFIRVIGGTLVVGMAWPDQDLLSSDVSEAEMDRYVAELQDLALRYLRAH